MIQTVTITSQGQITIPAAMRKALKLYTSHKATIELESDKLIIKTVPDLLALKSTSTPHNSPLYLKDKNREEILELEKQAPGEAVADTYRKKHHTLSNNILVIDPCKHT